jgi:hypothetical protein
VTLQFTGSAQFLPYTESGFEFNTIHAGAWRTVNDILLGQAQQNNVITTMAQSNGQPFDLLSLDCLFFAGSGSDTVRVVSSQGDLVIFNQVFQTQTFSGPGWENLTFVEISLTSLSGVSASTRLDNIVVNPVPAPGAGMGVALAGLGLARRRR